MSTPEDRLTAPAADVAIREHGLGAVLRTSLPLAAMLLAVVTGVYFYSSGGVKLGMSAAVPVPSGLPSLRDSRPLVEPEPVKEAAAPAMVEPATLLEPRPAALPVEIANTTEPVRPQVPLEPTPQVTSPASPLAEPVKSVDAVPVQIAEAGPVIAAAKPEPTVVSRPFEIEPQGLAAAPQPPAQTIAVPPSTPSVLTGPTPKSGNLLLERGRGLLDQGNIAGARLFLERAANAESAEAALLLGSTFDPKWLQNRGVLGVAADPARARKWYLEAQRLGSSEAAARLSGLEPERR